MDKRTFIDTFFLQHCNTHSHNLGALKGDKWEHYKHDVPPTIDLVTGHIAGDAPLSIRLAKTPDVTHLACLDFDLKDGDDISDAEFKGHVIAVIEKLRAMKFRPLAFRSRGGRGVNVWVRWQGEQPVRDVRGAMLKALDECGLKEGKGHVANGEVEIYPAEWSYDDDDTPQCMALPMFGDRESLNDLLADAPLPDNWPRSAPPEHFSIPVEKVELPDPLYDESVVAEALKHVPHNDDVHLWHKVGYALKRAFHDMGFDLWNDWSSNSDQYQGEESLRDYWDRKLRIRSKGKIVTVGTIIHMAKKNGWTPPTGHSFSFTDLGMARMLADKYHDRLRWCSTTGDWYFHADDLWRVDEGNVMVRRMLISTQTEVQKRARALKDVGNDLGDTMMKFALRYEGSHDATRALKAAESLSEITIKLEDFDSDPTRIMTKNGQVMRFLPERPWVEIEECSPDLYITKKLGVSFDKNASCPEFKQWVADMFPDSDVAYFIKRMAGAALGGHGNKVKRVPFLFGESGDNGKTAFLKVLYMVFGDYGGMANPEMFANSARPSSQGQARADIVSLRGMRFVMMPEVSSQSQLDEATFRNFTGGEYRKARGLFQSEMQWEPLEMYWLAGNSKPRVASNLNATFNRFGLIEIDWSLPVNEQKEDYAKELVEREGPGILSWMATGWMGYRHDGRKIPEQMMMWIQGYQREEDAAHHFKEEILIEEEGVQTPLSGLWMAFEKYHKDKFGHVPIYKNRVLKKRLESYGIEFQNIDKKGQQAINWRLRTAADAVTSSTDLGWLNKFVTKMLTDEHSNSHAKMAATTILKEAQRLGVRLPTDDVKKLGGEVLNTIFTVDGVEGDEAGRRIVYLDEGVEFHRVESDEGRRYFIEAPVSDVY